MTKCRMLGEGVNVVDQEHIARKDWSWMSIRAPNVNMTIGLDDHEI
jgi:hypothetical protein